ncbi:MAG: hypothetical protein Q8N72_01610 [Candidatus Omnitrophota bacterium]|nr:hypothetical protein [Candidatus Omnitrophota bacterium]
MRNRSNNGIFIAVFVNIGSFFSTFLVKKLIIKNPSNILTGAGAIDIEKGIRIIDQ